MLKYIAAFVLLALSAPDSSACPQQRRGGAITRVVAAERAILRLPARVATAPTRSLSGRGVTASGYSYRATTTTTYAAPPTRFLFIPIPVR